jgi:3-carboxy-cis,cis-muconate cycloisomerase
VPGLELTFSDAECLAALDDERLLAAMARFEAALASASAQCGLFPEADAKVIVRICGEARFDVAGLASAARSAGTLAIPFVKELTARVAAASSSAASRVHSGATSQDVIDTAVALCLREASTRVLVLALRLGQAAASLARRHEDTAMAARTLLQPALPMPFGLKAAGWLSMLARALPAFRRAAAGAAQLQFGGPAGTLSAFGDRAGNVEVALAADLGLAVAPTPWHSGRDGFARLGAELAILAGIAAKVARDVSLLMQPEIGEASEASPGGSSSMAHKRNPSRSLLALEAGLRAPGLAATLLAQLSPEHERGLGQWQSQWLTLRELACAAASGLAASAEVLEGLEVDPAAMRENLARSNIPAEEQARGLSTARAMISRALAQWSLSASETSP